MILETTTKLKLKGGAVEECVLEYSLKEPCFVNLKFCKYLEKRYSGEDIFICLCALRKDLEKEGISILCNGSRIDAYPSRMTRQMSKGLKIYIMKMGAQATDNNLVNIFDSCDLEHIGTVSQQEAYYKNWLASLR